MTRRSLTHVTMAELEAMVQDGEQIERDVVRQVAVYTTADGIFVAPLSTRHDGRLCDEDRG